MSDELFTVLTYVVVACLTPDSLEARPSTNTTTHLTWLLLMNIHWLYSDLRTN